MATVRLTIEVDEGVAAFFQEIADARQQDVSRVIADRLSRQVDILSPDAAADYELSAEDWAAIDEGLDQADRGEVIPSEQVHAEIRAMLARHEG